MKRFYKNVTVADVDGGWQVMLDGRGLKTVAGKPQITPSHALAEALASEWDAQGETIDPKSFTFRDTADYAIEVVSGAPQDTITKLLGYAETDTLCYRADPEEPLFQRQLEVWEPVLTRIEQREGIKLVRVSGIIHRDQSPEALARLKARLEALDPFTLAGLELLASLAASLTVALEVLEPGSDADALWNAASLEEDWQAELWGRDEEAEQRREQRRSAFLRAAEWLKLVANREG